MTDTRQDFSRKMIVAINEHLGSWELTNVVGHIAAFLGNKMRQPFDTGDCFVSRDGFKFPRNSQYPIVALKASEKELRELTKRVAESNTVWVIYTRDMIDLTDDQELEKRFASKDSGSMNLLGIGIFGTKQELKPLTDSFPLWK